LLFTHRGLSGPAILQISSYWREGDAITIDLMGGRDLVPLLQAARQETPRLAVQTVLAGLLPRRVVHLRLGEEPFPAMIGDCSDRLFRTLAERFSQWSVKPVGSEGYRTAEVTLGGVSTEALDARTLEARQVPGLYFIGEVVDVTGWLGGYNFQWAWASAKAAGEVA
jgi:predicted Rossmann fold flavoprotein